MLVVALEEHLTDLLSTEVRDGYGAVDGLLPVGVGVAVAEGASRGERGTN